MRLALSPSRAFIVGARRVVSSFLTCATILCITPPAAADLCVRDGAYDTAEIAGSTFFSTRQQTKFAISEPHYPLASGATARYCFSRGCTGQLPVTWSDDEQRRLRRLRDELVTTDDAETELRFVRIAVLEMETWLYARLRSLDQRTVDDIMRRTSRNYAETRSESASWIAEALGSSDRFDKECATYAMEATQHLLVLANLGLLKHWNVTAPVYRYGIPGHWTAGLENRATCERYRFDLNTRAFARYELHASGKDPAVLIIADARSYSTLLPGMDRAGTGRPTAPRRPDMPTGASALKGPGASAAQPAR